jgi:hypothetical protein
MDHAKAALRVGNFLPAEQADLPAHVAINGAAQMGHVADIVHPRADEELGASRSRHLQEKNNLFRQMLAIAIENHYVSEAAIEPMAQARLD